jgi:elongation factor Ts
MKAAADLLRKKGIAKADKRADRAASEGQIVTWTSPDGSVAAMIELNCETDFVSRNDEFVALAKQLVEQVARTARVDGLVEVGAEGAYLGTPWFADKAQTVGAIVKAASAKTGEKVELRRSRASDGRHVGSVPALQRQGRRRSPRSPAARASRPSARQACRRAHRRGRPVASRSRWTRTASMRPSSRSEREIFIAQAKESGKPEAIAAEDGRGPCRQALRRDHAPRSSRGCATTSRRSATWSSRREGARAKLG